MKRADSLKRQLLQWLALPLLLAFGVDAWFSNRASQTTANQAFDRLLVASAQVIAEDMKMEGDRLVVDLPKAALQLLLSGRGTRIFHRVVAPDGSTASGNDDLPLPRSAIAPAYRPTLYSDEYHGAMIHLAMLRRPMAGAVGSDPVVIVVAETDESRQALSRTLLRDALLRQGLLLAAASAVAWFALGRSFLSLARLRDKLVGREPTDLSPIDPTDVPSEVRPLIDALNLRADRLAKLLGTRERFIADASHQMRTPLAEMRTQIDYSLRHDNDAQRLETLADVHAGIDVLGRLIGQMLLLARSDPDAIDDQRSQGVDLGHLVRAVALDLIPAARARNVDLRFETSAGRVFVRGNELLLHELVVNLLDNAIRHGRVGGTVTVRVAGYPEARLEIEDDGPGVPADERDLVFDRFYRGRDVRAPGSGLGLAIARNICLSHRALLELLAPASGRGLCVRIRFVPRYDPETASLRS